MVSELNSTENIENDFIIDNNINEIEREENEVNNIPEILNHKESEHIEIENHYGVIYKSTCIILIIFNLIGILYFTILFQQIVEYFIIYICRYNDTIYQFVNNHYFLLSLILLICYGYTIFQYCIN